MGWGLNNESALTCQRVARVAGARLSSSDEDDVLLEMTSPAVVVVVRSRDEVSFLLYFLF